MASERSPWPVPADAPAMEDLSKCVHCGLCLMACPTYLVTGLEVESPRGRIYLARAVSEGRLEMNETVQAHWDLCLQCRACEAVCPSGVPYGRIMEHTRAQVAAAPAEGGRGRRLRRLFLRNVIARRGILGPLMAIPRVLADSKIRTAAVKTRVIRVVAPLARLERQLPRRVGPALRPGDALAQPEVVRGNAVLFTGCVMGEVFGDVHRATGRVLARRGIAAVATMGQVCCGALSAHDGDLDFARKLARKNIDALEATGEAPIVVNSAGCGASMKEYGDLLKNDSKYAERARRFAARVKDATEYVAELGAEVPAQFEGRVTYQDPCHLAHAQRIRQQPRHLLHTIAGCEDVKTDASDVCCGAAGMYSLVEPGMSATLRSRKAEQFRLHRPDVVATANPGCQMQYEAAVREAGTATRVLHLLELLDEAEAAAEAARQSP
ncbi:4Fe-4S dicluster domain-containing protein [bacterium]|nr:4Fe-4S dicluster domain-containing protein [bacterium]